MLNGWEIGVRKPSTVSDWKKLIRNFRDDFPYNALTSLVVETFANAVDSGATRIDIQVEGNSLFTIIDNGNGMSEENFVEYHNIASMTKCRGETIGFAGVGAKVFLDRAHYTITETKSQSFEGATYWAFCGDSLEWQAIKTENKVRNETGTYVSVRVASIEDLSQLSADFVVGVLQRHYNAILMGYYKVKTVTVNGKNVDSWNIPVSQIEQRKVIDVKTGKHKIRGFIIKSSENLPEEYQGPFIVVYGKTVTQEWFRQYPLRSEMFYGLILADHLIEILRTSKSDFERTSMFWKKFNGVMSRVIVKWLDQIGARPKATASIDSLREMSEEIEKSINQVLKLHEFENIAKSLFQNRIQGQVAIKSEEGSSLGSETEGMQIASGTSEGGGREGATITEGDEEGTGIAEKNDGTVKIELAKRRTRGLIRIGFEEKPQDILEGWVDAAQRAVIVNTGHPAWRIAEGLTLQARDERVRVYHVLRTVFSTLVEEMTEEAHQETLTKLFSSWYDSCIKGY